MKDFSSYPNEISLNAKLQHAPEYPGSAFFVFDFDIEAIFGTKGRVPVCLIVDGHRFRSTIAVYSGVHMMVFNKQMREATGYNAGDIIPITLIRDMEERKVEIPDDVQAALASKDLTETFAKYSYTLQKEAIALINEAKKPETRIRRIAKLIERLSEK